MERRLWLVRHGHRLDFAQPEWFNTAPRRYDPPLSIQGQSQAQSLAQNLALQPIDHLFCSPFLRAIQTAAPLGEGLGLQLKVEAGLGEWLNPDWMTATPQLEPWESLYHQYPQIDTRYQARLIPTYPESLAAVLARVATISQQLLADFPGNHLWVGHSITLQGALTALLGQPPIGSFPFATVVGLTQTPRGWLLESPILPQ
ncbi:histidine phosphatase family protein [Synechocystis sp. LKSZ1]|uniref:histidine phosphatase family protein n=1 Tax=Synechocystis sp. LKSZ1 TaxID=3144951 RepID=UPI00336BE454